MIIDRLRFSLIEVNTNRILSRDLVVKEPQVMINLSGPSVTSFSIDQGQSLVGQSAYGINFKTYGQWIVPEIMTDTYGSIVLGAQLISKLTTDPKTGDLKVEGTGIMGYPKGIPWLENYNPIACDPIEIFQHIWAQLESYVNANLGVEVISNDPIHPSSTGTQMLPGFGVGTDGTPTFNFYAIFNRASDFNDAMDQMTQLAKDLPLDVFEDVSWNEDRSELNKNIVVAYPFGGVQQNHLTFKYGENVISAEKLEESEYDPVTDVIIRSWEPGKVYSAELSNADMTRARRTIMEEAVNISNVERAAAWAKKKLTKRNIPISFKTITIDPNDSNAPFGSFGLGDSIFISAFGFPWVPNGVIAQWHRVMSFTFTSDPTIQVGVQCGAGIESVTVTDSSTLINNTNSIENMGPNDVYISNKAGVTTYTGTLLSVGDTVTYDTSDNHWAICDSGDATVLSYFTDGAWNYDPIEYDPNAETDPTQDLNLLPNGYFTNDLAGWYKKKGQWIRVGDFGYTSDGCVRIDCDDNGEELQSAKITVSPNEILNLTGAVKPQDIVQPGGYWGVAVSGTTDFTLTIKSPTGHETTTDPIPYNASPDVVASTIAATYPTNLANGVAVSGASPNFKVYLNQNWVVEADTNSTITAPTVTYTFALAINTHFNGGDVTKHIIIDGLIYSGSGGFNTMSGQFTVPGDGTVNEVSVSLLVEHTTSNGVAFWDDIRLIPNNPPATSLGPDIIETTPGVVNT